MDKKPLEYADAIMRKALTVLQEEKRTKPSRENSETITLLETAMMWNNKDRATKGELPKNETHVSTEA